MAAKVPWKEQTRWNTLRAADDTGMVVILTLVVWVGLFAGFQWLFHLAFEDALVYYGIASWIIAGVLVLHARRRLATPAFIQHELRALKATKDVDSLRDALEWFFESIEIFLSYAIGDEDYELFVLSKIRDNTDLEDEEKPEDLGSVFDVITRDAVDRAHVKGSVEQGISKLDRALSAALASEKYKHKVRMALRDLYLAAPPTYREHAVRPVRNALVEMLEEHPVIGSGLMVVVGNIALRLLFP